MATPKRSERGLERRISVDVTQEEVDHAERGNSGTCMIAAALKKRYPEARAISVDLATIRFTDAKQAKRYIYFTPPIAQRALIHFDQGVHGEAFRLRAGRPAQVVEAGYVQLPNGKSRARQNIKQKKRTAKVTRTLKGRRNGKSPEAPVVVGGRSLPKAVLNAGGRGPQPPVENVTLAIGGGKIRRFGLRQLKP